VTITVNAPPAPVASAQTLTFARNSINPITLSASNSPTSWSYAQPSHGTVSGTAPNVTYTPNASYVGGDSFTFTAINAGGTSAPATVAITVSAPVAAAMISPTPGSTLNDSAPTFTWTAGVGVSDTWIWIGSTAGSNNLMDFGKPGVTSVTAWPALPTDGSTIYVRLWSMIDGALQSTDYTYTAPNLVKAAMISPAPGSTLAGPYPTFTWTAGTRVTNTWIWIGTAPGTNNLMDFGGTGATSVTAWPALPTNGSTIYVRLWSLVNGALQYNDYTYTAAPTAVAAAMISPAPGSTLAGPYPTFTWTAGTRVTNTWIWIGTAPGTNNLMDFGWGPTSVTVWPALPTDGSTIYVRLWSMINGALQYNDYTYTAAH
jgi:hypothetical protein